MEAKSGSLGSKMASGLVGARWERCGWDQRGNHAPHDPIVCGLYEGALEQGSPDRAEAPALATRCLGNSGSAPAEGLKHDLAFVQPRDRQQAARLRSAQFAISASRLMTLSIAEQVEL